MISMLMVGTAFRLITWYLDYSICLYLTNDLNRMLGSGWDFGLFGESAGKVFEVNVLDERVVLSLSAFFLILLPRDSNSDAVGKVADTLWPDELVELGIDAHIGSAHQLGDPLPDGLDSLGSLFLELGAVGQFVNVDGGVDGSFGEPGSLLFLYHNH